MIKQANSQVELSPGCDSGMRTHRLFLHLAVVIMEICMLRRRMHYLTGGAQFLHGDAWRYLALLLKAVVFWCKHRPRRGSHRFWQFPMWFLNSSTSTIHDHPFCSKLLSSSSLVPHPLLNSFAKARLAWGPQPYSLPRSLGDQHED